MKKLLIAIVFISSFLISQSLTKGWLNDDFDIPGKLYTNELEVLGGTPGVGKVLTDDGAGTGIAIWSVSAAAGANTALSNLASVAINQPLLLGTSDAFALGSGTKMWSDLFLASGGVINFDNGDVTLIHSANLLTISGGNVDIDEELTIGTDARHPMLGYATGESVNRSFQVRIGGLTDATQITLRSFDKYNADVFSMETVDTDTPTGGTNFDISADGETVTVKGSSETMVGFLMAAMRFNDTGTAYNISVSEAGGKVTFFLSDNNGAVLDLSGIANAKRIDVMIYYVTST